MSDRYSNRPDLKAVRQDLRNRATKAERVLWHALKDRGAGGLKFRRQHSINQFVLDFYCPEEKLAVEVDGGVHHDPLRAAYDLKRDAALARLGIQVLRVPNAAVFADPEMVAVIISNFARSRRSNRPPPTPPVQEGRQ
jgi:very-short-patch-repair endonuclease